MFTPDVLKNQYTKAFNTVADEGVSRFTEQHPDKAAPQLSHVCFKFSGMDDYRAARDAAAELGEVIRRDFNGKEVSWCKLKSPLEKGALRLEWLEMVEPKTEPNAFSGVTSIGYAVPALDGLVKIQSSDDSILLRYQSRHAADMALA